MSKYLLDEQPLLIMPKLAAKIGLNEAVFLQQVHYWNEINKKAKNNYKDGYHWTFNSVNGWLDQFPFWSKNTVQRTIKRLEDMQLVVTGNYNKLKIDRTKWYRIDYNVLRALEESPFTQIGKDNESEWGKHLIMLGLPLPETNSETNKETNNHILLSKSGSILAYYAQIYEETFGKEHHVITNNQLDEFLVNIETIANENDFIKKGGVEQRWSEIINEYFDDIEEQNRNPRRKSNDGSVNYFLGGDYTTGVAMRYAK